MKWYEDPVYIKMCDCEEIQGAWEPKICDYLGGDWFIDKDYNIGKTFLGIIRRLNPEDKNDCVDCGGSIFWAIESNIWLPRQGQLQEMIRDNHTDWHLLVAFQDWVRHTAGGLPIIPGDKFLLWSIEQLWLAFVMKEKHNKVWDGEKWDDKA